MNQKSIVSAAAMAAIGIAGVLTHTYFGRASARAKKVNCKTEEESSEGIKMNLEDADAAPVSGKVQCERSIDACINGTISARFSMLEKFLDAITECRQEREDWLDTFTETSDVEEAKLKTFVYEHVRSVRTSILFLECIRDLRDNVAPGCYEVCDKNESVGKLQKVVPIEQPCPALATAASPSKRKMSNLAVSEAEVVCNQKVL